MPKQPETLTKPDAEEIYSTLRDRICLLDYPPGTLLRETVLAREFGISRTPLRSILQRLIHDGLIESRDGVGTIVTAPEFSEVQDVYLMRLKIAELIGHMNPLVPGPDHLAAANALVKRARGLMEDFDVSEYWRINHDQHVLISKIIGNVALRAMWDRFYFQAARMWYAHARNSSYDVSEDLLAELTETRNAIEQGDAVAIGYIQRNHIAYGLNQLISQNSSLVESPCAAAKTLVTIEAGSAGKRAI